jgi:hypothetical protein
VVLAALDDLPEFEPVITRRAGLIRRGGRSLSPAAQQRFDLFAGIKPGKQPRLMM